MKPPTCAFEPAVREAALHDRWTPELHQHADTCATCRDTLRVLEAMRLMSARSAASPPGVPPYHTIWLRAEYARTQRHRSQRRRFEVLATVALTAPAVALLFLLPPHRGVDPALLEPLASALNVFAGGIPAAAIVGLVTIALVWFADLRSHGA
jgi:hypothetical protein